MTVEEWLNNNELAITIWKEKYCRHTGHLKDNDWKALETFDEWLNRISGKNQIIRKLILEKKFSFGGRINMGRGLQNFSIKITYSNCYVIAAPEDNIESIFKTGAKLARTYSYGGGCGIDVSKLRPKNSLVNNAAKTTSGATSFMNFFSFITGLICQEGRRGALMISIDCTHPDLEDFINLKSDLNMCTKANISVKVTDAFMHAVENNLSWNLTFTTPNEIITKTVNAKDIFMLLAKRNWESAEPGILYWDTISSYNMLNKHEDFSYAGTNPCAEEPLPAGGSCLLGSINLAEFVVNPFNEGYSYVDYQKLSEAVKASVVALNEVLIEGIKLHPLAEQRESVRDWRQIGLGTMGLGDMLIKLGITYGSEKSLKIINEVYDSIAYNAIIASLELAKEKGCYPKCDTEALAESFFIQYILRDDLETINQIREYGLYNSQLLTCAPTGSIGNMYQVSTGIEPNFAFKFNRKTESLNGEETTYKIYANIVEQYKSYKLKTNSEFNDILPEYFISSQQIKPVDRIKVQGTIQKYIDASISSTINLPESTTIEEVADIYMNAWKYGLKGVTIYRDNCQRKGILTTDTKKDQEKQKESYDLITNISSEEILPRGFVRKVNDDCIGLKRTLTTGCGTLHCEAFFDPITGDLLETYLSKGSKGGCNNFMIGLSRMISIAARGGISIDGILDQLKSCGTCPSYAVRTAIKKDTSIGSCCPVAVGNALKDMHEEVLNRIKCCNQELKHKEFIEESQLENNEGEECPKCHHKTLIHTGGCVSCNDCGYTKCD